MKFFSINEFYIQFSKKYTEKVIIIIKINKFLRVGPLHLTIKYGLIK